MTVKTVYRYSGANGEVVSPVELPMAHSTLSRLIADSGKMITNDGESLFSVLDTDSLEGYYEVDAPAEEQL